MDITDVRKKLWEAYNRLKNTSNGIEGKSSEAYVEVQYPSYWDCETEEEFVRPVGIMIYSYALGPSREHYFIFGDKEEQTTYYSWVSKDPYTTAVNVIESWIKEAEEADEDN